MAARLEIDNSTILDNIDERQVEFTGEVDGDEYEFAVQYDVLEALTGDAPDGDAVDTFNRYIDPISDAALSSLSRNSDQEMIIVSENDLD
jgi:inhibitor of KinA sporulation pathway (predicted exonuclease)